jgi:serine/threonine protein kinase
MVNLNGDIESRIVDAYAKLHKLGVIHVDIRPENILVLKDGSIRIIDFDCSCIASEERDLIAQEDDETFKMFEELRRKRDSCSSCSP